MRQIADLHIHSKYSRACSPALTLENIDKTCRVKGVDIIATGDFTFPNWFSDIKKYLSPDPSSRQGEGGLYLINSAKDDKVKFILSTELALIYKKNDKCRRIHIVVHAPNIKAVTDLNKYLDKHYNIRSDGRPILGMSAEKLMKLCLSIHPKFLIYPAHIWTPWFSVFGSKSGFDSMEECFGEYTKDIFAYETGLSSDPEMNWRLSALDGLTLLSNSDAHSLPNIAREANVFELENITYDEIYKIIKERRVKRESDSYLNYTIEFYPEEGMYHYDGHRACQIRFSPQETKKHKGICPKCKKPLIIGVMNRVNELADRLEGYKPKKVPGFKKLVELDKIIAEVMGIKSRKAKKVLYEYNNIIRQVGTELKVLIDEPIDSLLKIVNPMIVEGIRRVREGKMIIKPGFDGQYGEIKIFSDKEKHNKQLKLF